MKAEQEPFLDDESEAQSDSVPNISDKDSAFSRWATIHIFLIITYTVICIAVLTQKPKFYKQDSEFPRLSVDFLETQSQYTGSKREESTKAWADALAGVNIRAEGHEVEAQGISSVALPEGGFLVWRESMHQLHCVKRIREWLSRDEYYPNLNQKEEALHLIHVEHCVEVLRQSVMCNPDSALVGFHWQDGKDRPEMNLRAGKHSCVDWDAYVSEMRTRSISRAEMNRTRRSLS